MRVFCISILYMVVIMAVSSCHYRLYKAVDQNGKKHKIRGYKSYKREHKYYDKTTVRYQYKKENYNLSPGCVAKTDTSVNCDSIKLFVQKDSRQFAPVFTSGIISCKLMNYIYGPMNELPGFEPIPGKELKDTVIKSFAVFNFHRLKYIHGGRRCRFYQFQIVPYWFYVELTNKKAKRRTKNEDFIKGSELTWFYRSNVISL